AAFKNIFDWISRIEKDVWMNKPMFLLATSPGKHGGKSVLDIAENKFKRMNKNAIFSFSLPSFNKNFSEKEGITDKTLLNMFNKQLVLFELTL
ncbi:MAG: NAD(P)H-dependent oxidoreductase, partial [Candidatus Marinimicrobia bacterium]|nr:NAD(P)H-dependent oxidoreductase [Candidatus Neomarinimicrobiota bacterium]